MNVRFSWSEKEETPWGVDAIATNYTIHDASTVKSYLTSRGGKPPRVRAAEAEKRAFHMCIRMCTCMYVCDPLR